MSGCCRKSSQQLAQLPVMVQANAEFFLKGGAASRAMCLLKEDQIHLLGSDCHNLSSRKPNLGEALERISQKLGGEALERIHTHEKHLLKNLP